MFQAVIKTKEVVNKVTSNIIFKIQTEVPKDNVNWPSPYYPSLSMVGKHFLVSDASNHRIKRHYTTANCMEQSVYIQYIALMEKAANN